MLGHQVTVYIDLIHATVLQLVSLQPPSGCITAPTDIQGNIPRFSVTQELPWQTEQCSAYSSTVSQL